MRLLNELLKSEIEINPIYCSFILCYCRGVSYNACAPRSRKNMARKHVADCLRITSFHNLSKQPLVCSSFDTPNYPRPLYAMAAVVRIPIQDGAQVSGASHTRDFKPLTTPEGSYHKASLYSPWIRAYKATGLLNIYEPCHTSFVRVLPRCPCSYRIRARSGDYVLGVVPFDTTVTVVFSA